MDRRTYLNATAGIATGLTVGLAGCSRALGTVPPPTVPKSKRDKYGWKRIDSQQLTLFEDQYANVTVGAKAHTLVYENVGLRAELKEKTMGQVDTTVSMFSATHIDLNPNLDNLPVAKQEILNRTETNAREQFESQMEQQGLQNVEQADTGSLEIDTGETASLTRYTAEFPIESFEFELTSEKTLTIEGKSLAIAGDVAVWHHDDYVVVAGGAYPAENFATSINEQLSSAITVNVEIDLGLTPEAYRTAVQDTITSVV